MKAWSHSSLTSFETCAKRYWHLNVQKDYVEPKSDHQSWGLDVHKAMERRLKNGEDLPLGMRQYEPLIAPLAALPVDPIVEQKLAIDVNLQPTSWFGDPVWCRVIIDAAFISGTRALVLDWKTGKRKDDNDQLALMAGVMFAQMPELDLVESGFVWLQEPLSTAIARASFTRGDIPAIWDRFLGRVSEFQRAHATTEFPPSPSGICRRFCPVRSCPYHGAS